MNPFKIIVCILELVSPRCEWLLIFKARVSIVCFSKQSEICGYIIYTARRMNTVFNEIVHFKCLTSVYNEIYLPKFNIIHRNKFQDYRTGCVAIANGIRQKSKHIFKVGICRLLIKFARIPLLCHTNV